MGRRRRTLLAAVAAVALGSSALSGPPFHPAAAMQPPPAGVEFLAVRDWTTFATWPAPGGGLYTADVKASVAHDAATGDMAWQVATRCRRDGHDTACTGELRDAGLAGYVDLDHRRLWDEPWGGAGGATGRGRAGALAWQGDWHDPASARDNWYFAHGVLAVRWTVPGVESGPHEICSNDADFLGIGELPRGQPFGCF